MSGNAGRELWTFQTGGQLLHVASKQCASLGGDLAGEGVVMRGCEGAETWELLPSGQLKVGALCLSQSGPAAGLENVAARAAAVASSTADLTAHGAAAAVDLNEATYWASKLGGPGPVTFSVDLGAPRSLEVLRIGWAFPAKAFSVAVSEKGDSWTEVFATSVNVVNTTVVDLGGARAARVKITMQEPHPVYGAFQGHVAYGIRSLSLLAPQLLTVADECTAAARSKDARDKYFAVHVPDFDPAIAQGVRSEMPELEAAKASLSAAVGEVLDLLPKMRLCQHGGAALAARPEVAGAPELTPAALVRAGSGFRTAGGDGETSAGALRRAVAQAHGVDGRALRLLLQSAKSAIVQARGLLA